jgi:4'-phosphopantetheinyl transferase
MVGRWSTSAGRVEPVGADTVHVWLIRSDLPPAVLAGLERLLDAGERRRADALTFPEHRRWFVVAHGAVRAILARHLGVPPDEIGWAYGPHGKPELAGALAPARCGTHVSLSHSDGVALLAVAARRVGVDIQRLPHRFDATGMALRYFPRAEARYVAAAGEPAAQIRRFIGLWARKEACVKVTGGRLMQGMALPVRAADGQRRTGVVVHQPAAPVTGPYLVRDLVAPSGFRAAVAVEGAQGDGIARHRWRPPLTPP